MNISPSTPYTPTHTVYRQRTKRSDNTDSQIREHLHSDRRTHAERRRYQMNYHNSIDMRQNGDRRKSNRIFITT